MAQTKEKTLDAFIGIPVPKELKKRVKKLAEASDPPSKTVTLARQFIEEGAAQREARQSK